MVRIVQISDTHLRSGSGPGGSAADELLGCTVSAIGTRPIDLVLLSGDLTDDGTVVAMRRVAAQVAELRAPILAIAGNHDDPSVVAEVFGAARPVMVGGWRILPLSSLVPGADGGSIDVADSLATIDSFDARPTMLVMHHPPASPSVHPVFAPVGGEELVVALDERPHVRLVATGHLHEAFARRVGGLTVVGCPSTLYALRHTGGTYGRDPEGAVGARSFELDDDGSFTYEVIARADPARA